MTDATIEGLIILKRILSLEMHLFRILSLVFITGTFASQFTACGRVVSS